MDQDLWAKCWCFCGFLAGFSGFLRFCANITFTIRQDSHKFAKTRKKPILFARNRHSCEYHKIFAKIRIIENYSPRFAKVRKNPLKTDTIRKKPTFWRIVNKVFAWIRQYSHYSPGFAFFQTSNSEDFRNIEQYLANSKLISAFDVMRILAGPGGFRILANSNESIFRPLVQSTAVRMK